MSSTTSTRRAWLNGRYDATQLTPEASPRRYFRSAHPDTRGWLRVQSDQAPPVETTQLLLDLGVRVPRLGPRVDDVYLVEDLGDVHLLHAPTLAAYQSLLRLHRRYFLAELPANHPQADLALDEALFQRELAQFDDYFVAPHLHRIDAAKSEALRDFLAEVAVRAAAGPQALQHRDLHSRNVLIVEGEIVLIDHQDMRRGPLLYDLASLRTDAYIDLDTEVVELLDSETLQLGSAAGLSTASARQQFAWTALQRVLKALGTFGKLQAEGRHEYAPAEQRAWQHFDRLFEGLSSTCVGKTHDTLTELRALRARAYMGQIA